MIFRRLFAGPDDHVIEPLTAADAEAVAALHDEGFRVAWSADEFAAFLAQETVFGFAARPAGRSRRAPDGFVLARLAAGEAEILTISVARARRGRGLGRALMDAVLRRLHAERAEAVFLEVDEENRWAVALYRRIGFREVGRRPGYYRQFGGAGALVMRLDLR
jgi:ribosomal-protein-alanine N-acetyltransferase